MHHVDLVNMTYLISKTPGQQDYHQSNLHPPESNPDATPARTLAAIAPLVLAVVGDTLLQ